MDAFNSPERAALYAHLRSFESDFDKSQSQMRAICSAWSAAVLGAIALTVTSAYTPPAGLSSELTAHRADVLSYLRNLICIVGSGGVFAFWFIDQGIYQRLLHAVFGYGLYVEWKYPELPQIRSSLYIGNLDITNGLAWFYRTQFWTFAIIAGVFVSQPFGIDLGPTPKGIKAITEIHVIAVIAGEIYSRRWPSLQAFIGKVFPHGFAASVPSTLNDVDIRAWRTRVQGPPEAQMPLQVIDPGAARAPAEGIDPPEAPARVEGTDPPEVPREPQA